MNNQDGAPDGPRTMSEEQASRLLAVMLGLGGELKPCPASVALHAFTLEEIIQFIHNRAAEVEEQARALGGDGSDDSLYAEGTAIAVTMALHHAYLTAAALLTADYGKLESEYPGLAVPDGADIVDWMHGHKVEWQCEAWKLSHSEQAQAMAEERASTNAEAAVAGNDSPPRAEPSAKETSFVQARRAGLPLRFG